LFQQNHPRFSGGCSKMISPQANPAGALFFVVGGNADRSVRETISDAGVLLGLVLGILEFRSIASSKFHAVRKLLASKLVNNSGGETTSTANSSFL
jgi:hypothetical protein